MDPELERQRQQAIIAVLRTAPPVVPNDQLREDGTQKDVGFLGKLKRPDGNVSTELSADAEVDGEKLFFPLLVPTLSTDEVNFLLQGNKPTKEILRKAIRHAQQRKKEGKSPFYSSSEDQ